MRRQRPLNTQVVAPQPGDLHTRYAMAESRHAQAVLDHWELDLALCVQLQLPEHSALCAGVVVCC